MQFCFLFRDQVLYAENYIKNEPVRKWEETKKSEKHLILRKRLNTKMHSAVNTTIMIQDLKATLAYWMKLLKNSNHTATYFSSENFQTTLHTKDKAPKNKKHKTSEHPI